MPIGPNQEKRPADSLANAIQVARIATGEIEKTYVNKTRSNSGHKGGASRSDALSAKQRKGM